MKNFNVSRAIAGGIVGTLLMTIITMMAPMMGMPKMDIAAMLGSMLGGPPSEVGISAWLVGFGHGGMIWLIAQLMVMPIMGAGFFSSRLPQGMMMAAGSLMGHLIYGAALGFVYGHQLADRPLGDVPHLACESSQPGRSLIAS